MEQYIKHIKEEILLKALRRDANGELASYVIQNVKEFEHLTNVILTNRVCFADHIINAFADYRKSQKDN